MKHTKSLTRREVLAGAASILASGFFANAQDGSRGESPKFSVNVEVVNVFVTVRDKKGNIIRDLVQEDFKITEDDRLQTIRYFARESDLPLTIGLIVDTTPSEARMLEEEKRASRVFLNKMLRPDKDNAFLIQYAGEVELLQDLTSSREKLERALNLLQRHSFFGGTGRGGPPGFYETVLADAVYLAAEELMKFQQGRKALIILGDGGHVGDRLDTAIEAAQKADTLIYGIRIFDREFGGGPIYPRMPGPGGGPGIGWPTGRGGEDRSQEKPNLKKLSGQTGGAFFEVSKKETLELIYSKIEEELRSQYNLGYTPEADARNGYRTIKVAVQKKGLVVHSREGYYPRNK